MNLLCEIKNEPNELCFIMDSNYSNKGSYKYTSIYNYTIYYYPLFINYKNSNIRLLEIGIDNNKINLLPGASLKGWKQFFSNGTILGIDRISKNIFKDKYIKTFFCDYTNNESIKCLWDNENFIEDFDIIILNTDNNNITDKFNFFEASYHKIKPGGVFIIENIKDIFVDFYQDKLEKWRTQYTSYSFRLFKIPNKQNNYDNRICIIQRIR
jgi:hypothetical protein